MINYAQGVVLVPLSEVSVDIIFSWRNHSKVRTFCRQNDLLSLEAHKRWYQKQLEGSTKEKMYGIRISKNPFPIGVCGLTDLDLINRRAEFSLYIGPLSQAQGFGKKALKTLLSHGFNAYGLKSIWGESFNFNPARDLFEDLGFKIDGIRRSFYYRDGKYVNAVLYSMLRQEWKSLKSFDGARKPVCSI